MTDRKYPLRMPQGWEPPYPSHQSRFESPTGSVSMVIFGIQYEDGAQDETLEHIRELAELARKLGKADFVDISACAQDSAGKAQIVATGYWFDDNEVEAFFATDGFQSFWSRHSQPDLGYGLFREVFNTPLDRFEVIHSHADHQVAISNVRDGLDENVRHHAYWGSMRDRIPASAHDPLTQEGGVEILEQQDNRIVVRPGHNLAIIRSGQDIRAADGTEKEEYYRDIEPVLIAGMDFLRDEGEEVNCFDCRFCRFVEEDGSPGKHSYGFGYFGELKDLEAWSEHHPTHLAIFGAFLKFMPKYGHIARSRFWHEVSVVPRDRQIAEYVNCAEGTGLLKGLQYA